MSHPIGTFVQRLTALALYEYGQLAMHAALDACAEARYATAACELEAGSDCAVTLAAMLDDPRPIPRRRAAGGGRSPRNLGVPGLAGRSLPRATAPPRHTAGRDQ